MSHRQPRSASSGFIGRCVLVAMAIAAAAAAPLAQGQVPISGTSLNPDGGNQNDFAAVTACNRAPQVGVLYRNSETEPHLAVNPLNPLNMIAGWHQDRWDSGGAQSLGAAYTVNGGATWTQVVIPFTRCSGAAPGSAGDYERASDPWISFGPDGTAHYMALVTDNSVNENAMVVARSTDGGASWSLPVVIARSPAQDPVKASLFNDKNTITADPHDARYVYATWTLFRTGFVSLVFSRSTDGGLTWSPAMPIATMGKIQKAERTTFRQGAQVVVLADGTLVNAFFRVAFDSSTGTARLEQAILRSTDRGEHWERSDIAVAKFGGVGAFDPELGIPVRDASTLPSVAASRLSNRVYIAWQDAFANGLGQVGVHVAVSSDRGKTWSAPVRANQGTSNEVQAFLPTVTVNAQGMVGVLFYDFRNDVLGDFPLSTDVHLSLFNPDLQYLGERRLSQQSFDLRMSAIARGYFPGDYVGLSSTGADFVAAFTRTNDVGVRAAWPPGSDGVFVDSRDRQSIVFVRQAP